MKKIGDVLKHPGVIVAEVVLTGLGVVACGDSGQSRSVQGTNSLIPTLTTPPATMIEPTLTFNVPAPHTPGPGDDGCQWSLSNRRPLGKFNGYPTVVIDSRCTYPPNDPTGIYTVPRQQEGQELRDGNGEPVRLPSGTEVVAYCVQRGERVQNDKGVGSEWWVSIAPPVLRKDSSPALVPEVHAGFPPHEIQPGYSADALPVCS